MEAQKKVFEKRLELQSEIKDVHCKGSASLTQVALSNSNLYKVPMVPSQPREVQKKWIDSMVPSVPKDAQMKRTEKVVPPTPKEVPMKRNEIINLEEQIPPARVPKKTGLNKSRMSQNNQQQEASVNESEIQYLEQVNRELEEQNGEIEIEVDIPSQMKQSLKDEKKKKKKKKEIQANCPVCSRLLSSRGAVKRHLRVVHQVQKNGELETIRFDKLSLQQNHEIPV